MNSTLIQRKNLPLLAVLLAGFIAGIAAANLYPTGFVLLSQQDVVERVISYINDNLMRPGSNVSLIGVEEMSGTLYKIITEYNGREIPVYATKDGLFLFLSQPINLSLTREKIKKMACESLPKSQTPKLEAFVVSYCPFGLQMQRILSEIVKEIPQLKNYIKIRYMGSVTQDEITSMHGEREAQENLRQICIREEQGDKFWDYISCFIKHGNSTACLDEANIDTEKLNACMQDSNRGLKYAQEDFDQQSKYHVTGSPTLILNGKRANEFDFGGRSADAVKTLLCCGFAAQPEYCKRNLTTATAAIGFSPAYSSNQGGSGRC